jgi:hypothetical protein
MNCFPHENNLAFNRHACHPSSLVADFAPTVEKLVGAQLAAEVLQVYFPGDFATPWWAAVHMFGDAAMSCAARQTSRWLTAPSRSGGAAPVYLYFFTHTLWVIGVYDEVGGAFGSRPLGCFHGSGALFGGVERDEMV